MRLRRSSAQPVEHEFIRARKNVGAVITDTEGNVAHQSDAALLGVHFNVPPLLVRDPLHVTKEISASCEGCLLLVGEVAQPAPSIFDRLMRWRPLIPGGAAFIFLDENAEQRVIMQPRGLFLAELFELWLPILIGASREVHKRLLKNSLLEFFDLPIFYAATPQAREIGAGERVREIIAR